ncbi:MAG: hypothetical protein F6K31_30205 [Symploca sp. SIO2G7]|nr:hypothetical protein [Symploca sp. SIO2G7]
MNATSYQAYDCHTLPQYKVSILLLHLIALFPFGRSKVSGLTFSLHDNPHE